MFWCMVDAWFGTGVGALLMMHAWFGTGVGAWLMHGLVQVLVHG
jgi:hypothetical protein